MPVSWMKPRLAFLSLVMVAAMAAAPTAKKEKEPSKPAPRPGEQITRTGDEIMVCGQLFHTGTRVVLWTDPGGYDAYRIERRFVKWEDASWEATTQSSTAWRDRPPERYNLRESVLSPEEIERVRGGGWDLPLLQQKVDQFVLHYDVCGISRLCFQVLHDSRGLSVHFLLDIDGTIYQTLDLKERAWHATVSNSRSIGIEIANMGSYNANQTDPFKQWYSRDGTGKVRIAVPERFGDGGILTPNFLGRPARDRLIWGEIQGKRRRQWDFTPQQYDALTKLTAALCVVFPNIKCDFPRDQKGRLITHTLDDDQLEKFQGVLGHYHVQADKQDPGPAFQWDRVINGARKLIDPKLTPLPPATMPSEEEPEPLWDPAYNVRPEEAASSPAHAPPATPKPPARPTTRPTKQKDDDELLGP